MSGSPANQSVAIDSGTQVCARCRTGLTAGCHPSAERRLGEFCLVGRDIDENPVEEVCARKFCWDAATFLVDVIGNGQCIESWTTTANERVPSGAP